MNMSKLIVAAGFAVATTSTFAETGEPGSAANVYGRASIATVQIKGDVLTQPANVAEAAREAIRGKTAIAVTSDNVQNFGRS